jgi:DNA invertase Pin-like site-specific DNA recombinase
VLTANGDDLTDTSDPSRIMMRQIAGAFSEFERRRVVHTLNVARDRKTHGQGQRPQDIGRIAP